MSAAIDLEAIQREAESGKCPHHVMWGLSQTLKAKVHQPGIYPISLQDRLAARITSQPAQWALARSLVPHFTHQDVVFCVNEDVGIPIAAMCASQHDRPKIAMYVTNMNRPRGRIALRLFRVASHVDRLLTPIPTQYEFFQEYLKLPEAALCLLRDQTDTQFFKPGIPSPEKSRPLIVSGGMERRDYRTLAEAIQDLDVDVKVCAFSRNAAATARTFPPVMPANMYCGYFGWVELLQLYRDADVVVVPLFANNYSAGFTTLIEAMACRKPVIITESEGTIAELIQAGCVTGVKAGDPEDLKRAIEYVLTHPEASAAQADRGYERVMQRHSAAQHIEELVAQLTALRRSE